MGARQLGDRSRRNSAVPVKSVEGAAAAPKEAKAMRGWPVRGAIKKGIFIAEALDQKPP